MGNNKYARIDKLARKAQVYAALYHCHGIFPRDIARKFGVSIQTVVRGIKLANHLTNTIGYNHYSWTVAKQLAWTFVY